MNKKNSLKNIEFKPLLDIYFKLQNIHHTAIPEEKGIVSKNMKVIQKKLLDMEWNLEELVKK